jgi:hypothetical protein
MAPPDVGYEPGLFGPLEPAREAQAPESRAHPPASAPSPEAAIAPNRLGNDGVPTLAQALRGRVRVGAQTLPLSVPIGIGAIAVAFAFGAVTALIGAVSSGGDRTVASASAAQRGDKSPTAETAQPAAEPAPAGTTTLDRAASGDEKALFELTARAPKDRTIAEALAIHTGQAALRRKDLATLAKESKNPGFANDASNIKKLFEYVKNEETARPALEITAALESNVGPDALYHIWTSTTKRSATTELAEALAMSKEVRARATPALAVALDLRAAQSCEQTKKAVTQAIEHGDRRAIPLLVKLQKKSGCGDKKRDDCYPCLRDGDELKDALKEARKRPNPRF